jgi:predicted enzyme related to lactoylglutathione lyase
MAAMVAESGGMTLRIQAMTVDAHDPSALATFWGEVLGWKRTYESDIEVVIEDPAGGRPDLLFLRVDDDKTVKNRLHLDLRPEIQATEVARVEALGATRVDIGQGEDVTWVVLADPEGNEFCILRRLNEQELLEES